VKETRKACRFLRWHYFLFTLLHFLYRFSQGVLAGSETECARATDLQDELAEILETEGSDAFKKELMRLSKGGYEKRRPQRSIDSVKNNLRQKTQTRRRTIRKTNRAG